MIVPRYYEDLAVLHENTLPARSYYIPSSTPLDPGPEARDSSDRLQLLNGEWSFRYFESIHELGDHFYERDFPAGGFDRVPVPSTWQHQGYDHHQYTNIRYPFPLDPPFVPQDNPCGAYVHEFEYTPSENAPSSHLTFEGVDSCFYVWLNGRYIGYSQVSHATSEFDVTGVVEPGATSLALAAALHPSAAVCGTPTHLAMDIIAEVETIDRGRYAGPVGWVDMDGDGEWAIALRGGQVRPESPESIQLFAGAGIVADSTPSVEVQETAAKFVPMLQALGVAPA